MKAYILFQYYRTIILRKRKISKELNKAKEACFIQGPKLEIFTEIYISVNKFNYTSD